MVAYAGLVIVRGRRGSVAVSRSPNGLRLGRPDFDDAEYVETEMEVSAGNSVLMRNIRRSERALEGAIAGICGVVMAARAL